MLRKSRYHIFYEISEIRKLTNSKGYDRLIPAFSSSIMKVYPHQIAETIFALDSKEKGLILGNEAGLGKTFTSMIFISQNYIEGKKILIVTPISLIGQWSEIMNNNLTLDYKVLNGEEKATENIFDDRVILTTYEYLNNKFGLLKQASFDIVIFDEAQRLGSFYNNKNKYISSLRESIKNSFKLLLTPLPFEINILKLYGIIKFIDDNAFWGMDKDTFFKRYYKKEEKYKELLEEVNKYCFRTLKAQVKHYVKIPNRIIKMVKYNFTKKEEKLYKMIEIYLKLENKKIFPKMELYDLTLMFTKNLSSSVNSFSNMLENIIKRAENIEDCDEELNQLKLMLEFSNSIKSSEKTKQLELILKKGFNNLKSVGANKKAIIFTESKATQNYLYNILNSKYKVLVFNGDNSRDYKIIDKFKREYEILIATDIASEGFNLDFCCFVINYDLPYNVLKLEQRISRCHRKGQAFDVLVVNFFNVNNFYDVRLLELIKKRLKQFNDIMGMTDTIIDFCEDMDIKLRSKEEIEEQYNNILEENKEENIKLLDNTETIVKYIFNKEIEERYKINPAYLKYKNDFINNAIWELAKFMLKDEKGFKYDKKTRTISILKSYIPKNIYERQTEKEIKYSMFDRSMGISHHNYLTFTSNITQKLINNFNLQVKYLVKGYAKIKVVGNISPCYILGYKAQINHLSFATEFFCELIGVSKTGTILNNEMCKEIMCLEVEEAKDIDYINIENIEEIEKNLDKTKYEKMFLDRLSKNNEINLGNLKEDLKTQKIKLKNNINTIKTELNILKLEYEKTVNKIEKLSINKKVILKEKELKKLEQDLFLDEIRLENNYKNSIESLKESEKFSVDFDRLFVLEVY
ncbi:DEAD/DEAH box helicase [[Clostridium] colinum]|uniref:DEAD/DEAH box helicase n=1 Tax=[Clostridium] colinum TaxID=36835 RepID=UPI002023D85D|nr:DEAD/DEAH box helicase [[Clostridium] colinum]